MFRKPSNANWKPMLAATLIVAAANAGATGLMTCDSGDRETWGTKSELREKLRDQGWTVKKIKVDGGCYEVYGVSPEKKRVEAYFDPVYFEKLLVVRRGEVLYRKNG